MAEIEKFIADFVPDNTHPRVQTMRRLAKALLDEYAEYKKECDNIQVTAFGMVFNSGAGVEILQYLDIKSIGALRQATNIQSIHVYFYKMIDHYIHVEGAPRPVQLYPMQYIQRVELCRCRIDIILRDITLSTLILKHCDGKVAASNAYVSTLSVRCSHVDFSGKLVVNHAIIFWALCHDLAPLDIRESITLNVYKLDQPVLQSLVKRGVTYPSVRTLFLRTNYIFRTLVYIFPNVQTVWIEDMEKRNGNIDLRLYKHPLNIIFEASNPYIGILYPAGSWIYTRDPWPAEKPDYVMKFSRDDTYQLEKTLSKAIGRAPENVFMYGLSSFEPKCVHGEKPFVGC